MICWSNRSYIIPAKYFIKISNDVSEPLTRDNADEHCNDQRHTEYWSEDHTWIPAEKFDIIEYTNPNPVKGWWCPNEEISEQELSVLKLKVDSDETRAFFIAREEKKKDEAETTKGGEDNILHSMAKDHWVLMGCSKYTPGLPVPV